MMQQGRRLAIVGVMWIIAAQAHAAPLRGVTFPSEPAYISNVEIVQDDPKAPAGFDASATHTIGIYGSRNLTVYNLGTNYASATFNFVPGGAAVTHVHDIIADAELKKSPAFYE